MSKKDGVINGTHGKLWLDNELVKMVKSFEVKHGSNFEEFFICGDLEPHQKLININNEGTMVLMLSDYKLQKKIIDANNAGTPLKFKLNGETDDPEAETGRVVVDELIFTEVTAMKFESNTLGEVELPFKARGVRLK